MSFEVTVNNNQDYPVILLKDKQKNTIVEIYALGGLLNAFQIETDSGLQNIVAGFESVADSKLNITNGFKSAKLSPFVCRMKHGKYNWKNENFQIQKYFLGKHAIHGIIYDACYKVDSTKADDQSASANLIYDYDATEKGYPFPYTIEIFWELKKDNHLKVTTSIFNKGAETIPISDGWHPYFNLGGSINDYDLQFDSKQMLEFDAELIPTGKLIEDERFHEGRKMENLFLDNCFLLDQSKGQPICKLKNKNLQLTIIPDSNYPYLQLYTPDDRKRIAIENLSAAPDAFNNKMGLLNLEPQQKISFSTTYVVAGI